jgi:Right handed beta helix region
VKTFFSLFPVVLLAGLLSAAPARAETAPAPLPAVSALPPGAKAAPHLRFGARLCIAEPVTVTVSPGDSLQEAVRDAAPGTVILVRGGTYEGGLDLSGVRGTPGRPILLVSADGPGAARIVGTAKRAAIGAWGVANVGVYGFEIVSDNRGGDIGGIKIAGPWRDPARDIVFAGNIVTGEGMDGAKFFNGAKDVVFAGNVIEGRWRQEAIDLVSVEDSIFAYNTVKGYAKYTGITVKAGSRNIVVMGNEFGSLSSAGIFIGGYGTSRFHRSFPDYWKGFEARNVYVHHNVVANAPRSVVFIGANGSLLENNHLSAGIHSRSVTQSGHFTYRSFDNRILNNTVPDESFFRPEDKEHEASHILLGNMTKGPRPAAGAADLPGDYMGICPGGGG